VAGQIGNGRALALRRNYVVSFAVLAVGFLLLVSLLVSAGLAAAGKYAATYLPEGPLHIVSMLTSFTVGMALFAMTRRYRRLGGRLAGRVSHCAVL
jgi:hypothetical protein